MAKRGAKTDALDLDQFELMLAARNVPGANRLEGYRLKQWPAGMVSAYTMPMSQEIDVSKMCVTSRISTPTPDLSNDIVIGKGIDVSIHKSNPLVLLQHNPMCPVARAQDREGNYTVRMVGEDTFGTAYFFQSSPESEQTFRLVELGALNGASVKIKPKSGAVEMVRGPGGEGPFAKINECLLYEYSIVFFPDNPEALTVAIEKGLNNKPILDSLKAMFLPLLPARAPIVNGATLPKAGDIIPADQIYPVPPSPDNPLGGYRVKCSAGCACEKCKAADHECVARKIEIFSHEHPDWSQDKRIAAAYGYCGEKKMSDENTDHRPHGAQYGSAMYEMAVAMSEFAEEQGKALEPESAEAFGGVHEHIHGLMKYLAKTHNDRYPDLPALGKSADEEEPGEENRKHEDESEKARRKAAMTDEERAADDAREKAEQEEREAQEKLGTNFRKLSRGLVRGWWGERMKAVSQAETGVVSKVRSFLLKAANHRGPWSNAEKRAASKLADELKTPKPETPTPTPPPIDDGWGAVANRLEKREAALAMVADRAAKLGV